ncbi:hypothetical protein D3C79_809930 [compost metagenome]
MNRPFGIRIKLVRLENHIRRAIARVVGHPGNHPVHFIAVDVVRRRPGGLLIHQRKVVSLVDAHVHLGPCIQPRAVFKNDVSLAAVVQHRYRRLATPGISRRALTVFVVGDQLHIKFLPRVLLARVLHVQGLLVGLFAP